MKRCSRCCAPRSPGCHSDAIVRCHGGVGSGNKSSSASPGGHCAGAGGNVLAGLLVMSTFFAGTSLILLPLPAAGLIGRPAPARDIVAGNLGHLRGEHAHLDVTGDRKLVLHLLLGNQFRNHTNPLEGDSTLRRQRSCDSLVIRRQHALAAA